MSDGKTGEQVYIEQLEARVAELEAAIKAERGFVIAASEHKSVSEVLSARLVTVEHQRDDARARVAELERERDTAKTDAKAIADDYVRVMTGRDAARAELQTIHLELSALSGCATDGHNAVQMATALKAERDSYVKLCSDRWEMLGKAWDARDAALCLHARQVTLNEQLRNRVEALEDALLACLRCMEEAADGETVTPGDWIARGYAALNAKVTKS
jgi:chromosome segregation ATPase